MADPGQPGAIPATDRRAALARLSRALDQGHVLEYFCNGRLDYQIRGIHVRLEARWEWQAQAGDDTHQAVYRGSRARLELRQGAAEGWRPELYVVPEAEIAPALGRRIAALQPEFPGLGLDRRSGEWRVIVPD